MKTFIRDDLKVALTKIKKVKATNPSPGFYSAHVVVPLHFKEQIMNLEKWDKNLRVENHRTQHSKLRHLIAAHTQFRDTACPVKEQQVRDKFLLTT